MTPKEKAEQLIESYVPLVTNRRENGKWDGYYLKKRNNFKQCALVAVDEIINALWEYHIDREYWQDVKNEIEKL